MIDSDQFRRDSTIIAQRFITGKVSFFVKVPKGRLKQENGREISCPFGTAKMFFEVTQR